MLWCDFGIMFDFGFAEMFSDAIFEIYFHPKDIRIAASDYYMYFQSSTKLYDPL